MQNCKNTLIQKAFKFWLYLDFYLNIVPQIVAIDTNIDRKEF